MKSVVTIGLKNGDSYTFDELYFFDNKIEEWVLVEDEFIFPNDITTFKAISVHKWVHDYGGALGEVKNKKNKIVYINSNHVSFIKHRYVPYDYGTPPTVPITEPDLEIPEGDRKINTKSDYSQTFDKIVDEIILSGFPIIGIFMAIMVVIAIIKSIW